MMSGQVAELFSTDSFGIILVLILCINQKCEQEYCAVVHIIYSDIIISAYLSLLYKLYVQLHLVITNL